MKIRRIIIYNKKKVKYSMLIEEVKMYIKKSPIFIGTPKQWNKFLIDIQASPTIRKNNKELSKQENKPEVKK